MNMFKHILDKHLKPVYEMIYEALPNIIGDKNELYYNLINNLVVGKFCKCAIYNITDYITYILFTDDSSKSYSNFVYIKNDIITKVIRNDSTGSLSLAYLRSEKLKRIIGS